MSENVVYPGAKVSKPEAFNQTQQVNSTDLNRSVKSFSTVRQPRQVPQKGCLQVTKYQDTMWAFVRKPLASWRCCGQAGCSQGHKGQWSRRLPGARDRELGSSCLCPTWISSLLLGPSQVPHDPLHHEDNHLQNR